MALSDLLAPSLQIGSTVLSAGSQVARGIATKAVAQRRRAELEFEAKQLDAEAGQSQAASQRSAEDVERNVALVNSAALARAAASGAGASDPTVLKIISRTAQEGAYRRDVALYEGEAQARLDRMRAGAMRFEGAVGETDANSAKSLANMGAVSTVLSGVAKATSMFSKEDAPISTMYEKYFSKPEVAETDFGNLGPLGQNLDFG